MAEDLGETTIRIEFGDPSSGGGGKGGGIASLVGAGVGLGAGMKIGADLVGIAQDALSNVFKPVKNLLYSTFRILGEFLRPIVEVVVNLLRPILSIIKPILTVFKTLIQPAIDTARKLSTLSAQAFAAGDSGTGTAAAFAAFQVLIGPIVIALSATLIKTAVDTLSSVVQFALNAVAQSLPSWTPDWIRGIFTSLSGGVATATTMFDSSVMDGAKKMIGAFTTLGDAAFSQLNGTFQQFLAAQAAANAALTVLNTTLATTANNANKASRAFGGVSAGSVGVSADVQARQGLGQNNAQIINDIVNGKSGSTPPAGGFIHTW